MIADWLARQLRWPAMRAIRGATTVEANNAIAIRSAVIELLNEMVERNEIRQDELVSAIFTMTPDLYAAFPAEAARLAGWHDVPLLCTTEIAVPGALTRCLRILLHVQRSWSVAPIPVYLHGAVTLRPDLAHDTPRGGIAFHPQSRQHPLLRPTSPP